MVIGGKGNDVVCGGLDDDEVEAHDRQDQLFVEEDNDLLIPETPATTRARHAGRDEVRGYGILNDVIVAERQSTR